MDTRYSWRLLRAGMFKLDGGSMFGLIPRSVWSRTCPPDDRGRIAVQHNCLLLERQGPPPAGAAFSPRRVLIETGTGDKLDARSKEIFEFESRSILDALREAGLTPEEVDAVAVTHLHFDHAGGLTRLCRAGEAPDWAGPASCFSGSRGEHGVKRTFPNARIIVQAREWDDALANRSVMTRTYFPDHLEPIRAQLRTIDSPRPFPAGYTPGREELPGSPAELRATEWAPGLFAFLVPGHTWGQQALMFKDPSGREIVFTPDVIPTIHHVGAAYSLGYDVEPYTSMVSRRWFLASAAERGWTLVLDHEPGPAAHAVRANDRGWFDLAPVG